MTVTVSEIELIEHLDFNAEQACEDTKAVCTNPGTWIVIKGCCGRNYILCELHADKTREFIESNQPMVRCFECWANGLSVENFTWRKL